MKVPVLYYFGVVIFLGNYDFSYCLRMKMIPGVPTISFIDTKYVENVIATTRRNGRRSDYIFNAQFTTKQTWTNNNISLHFIFYEFLHNEYKPSFVEMHFKLCDFIIKDFFLGSVVRKAGLSNCPMAAGRYHLMNMIFNDEFPSVWPFEKGKGELTVRLEPGKKEIIKGNLVLTFKII